MPMGTLGRVMVLALVAVIAGAGLCLFDVDDTAGMDLCTSAFATTIGPLLAMPLAPSGRFLPGLAPAYHLYPPAPPAPPPRA